MSVITPAADAVEIEPPKIKAVIANLDKLFILVLLIVNLLLLLKQKYSLLNMLHIFGSKEPYFWNKSRRVCSLTLSSINHAYGFLTEKQQLAK
jgi:uncharacterized membrane protein